MPENSSYAILMQSYASEMAKLYGEGLDQISGDFPPFELLIDEICHEKHYIIKLGESFTGDNSRYKKRIMTAKKYGVVLYKYSLNQEQLDEYEDIVDYQPDLPALFDLSLGYVYKVLSDAAEKVDYDDFIARVSNNKIRDQYELIKEYRRYAYGEGTINVSVLNNLVFEIKEAPETIVNVLELICRNFYLLGVENPEQTAFDFLNQKPDYPQLSRSIDMKNVQTNLELLALFSGTGAIGNFVNDLIVPIIIEKKENGDFNFIANAFKFMQENSSRSIGGCPVVGHDSQGEKTLNTPNTNIIGRTLHIAQNLYKHFHSD